MFLSIIYLLLLFPLFLLSTASIDRHFLVSRYTPARNSSNPNTPMQIGNGNFAFGADVTSLQTFLPFATLSSWGWKNDTLPPNRTIEDVLNYKGASWFNHGRLVQYDFGGDPEIEQWLTANPNRVNLGRVGLLWVDKGSGETKNVTENDLSDVHQTLDLWTGIMSSQFTCDSTIVNVTTTSAQDISAISVTIVSSLLSPGTSNSSTRLGVFLDFPWADGSQKFSAPFVGNYSPSLFANHTTTLEHSDGSTQIKHQIVDAIFYTAVSSTTKLNITRDSPIAHRYNILPRTNTDTLSLVISYNSTLPNKTPDVAEVTQSSVDAWEEYWTESGFVDLFTGSTDSRADELQRRIILSRYLMRVNEAGENPPQESGLVNNGWYGKFHMEEYFWHSAHWALWNNLPILLRSSSIYNKFLFTSIIRAHVQQGYSSGARFPKMTDPSGRSSPGEINNLLIWEQPHPLVLAEYEYRAASRLGTSRPEQKMLVLEKWADVVRETANWMSVFAWFNETTNVYDLGPPMYVVAEDTLPNVTVNPAFELAYWRFGLELAEMWMNRLGEEVPINWTIVKNNLAPLPIDTDHGVYAVYEGIENDFWIDPAYINDHPALVGLHGWLPPTPGLSLSIAKLTAEKIWATWNFSNCWGWDFPMLAMSAARNNETEKAVDWLLDPLFQFDDVGMPIGGVRVPTPYFPGSGALLYATAMMAQGWDGSEGNREGKAPGFPKEGWNIRVEGLSTAL
ncbi:Six-hairpin glycosidase-like protein [Lentinula aciculospora]|uniref:Six-hairpin glycosidase-like protein n=1 Tax=Lentinula aciculospora TaxID=153920 RepID=A0A9W9AHG4_9AGAR|nr:Six-hairpin glycosidase-like protein [Lentinula aciculospora]